MFSAGSSRRVLCLAVVALTLSGCSSWRLQEGPPRAAVEEANRLTGPVRVTLYGGKSVVVYRPQVVGDSLFGVLNEKQRSVEFSVPTADIKRIESRKTDEAKSIATTFVVIGVLAGLVLLISFGSAMSN
jgi:hypothetical protein